MDPHFDGVIFKTHAGELRRRMTPALPAVPYPRRAPARRLRARATSPAPSPSGPDGIDRRCRRGTDDRTEFFVVGSEPGGPGHAHGEPRPAPPRRPPGRRADRRHGGVEDGRRAGRDRRCLASRELARPASQRAPGRGEIRDDPVGPGRAQSFPRRCGRWPRRAGDAVGPGAGHVVDACRPRSASPRDGSAGPRPAPPAPGRTGGSSERSTPSQPKAPKSKNRLRSKRESLVRAPGSQLPVSRASTTSVARRRALAASRPPRGAGACPCRSSARSSRST